MKVTQLLGQINRLEIDAAEAEALSKALQRFGNMSIFEFSAFLKKQKLPPPRKNYAEISKRLEALKTKPDEFDAELDSVSKKVTKQDLQVIFSEIFDTRSTLPAKLTKSEMLDRFKRQRRRDANFASA